MDLKGLERTGEDWRGLEWTQFQHIFSTPTWGIHPFVEKNEFEYPPYIAVGSSEHSKIFWKV